MIHPSLETPLRVLFVSVHPDDETLGCAGTILKHASRGDQIFWLNLTGPSLSHPYGFSQEIIDTRESQLNQIVLAYQFKELINLSFPTQMLESVETRILVNAIDEAFGKIKPNILYISNRSDVHSDHRVAFDALYACTKSFRKPYLTEILMYETLSETEFAPPLIYNSFSPNCFVDITEYMDKKLEIMQIYDTEIQPSPYPRSLDAIKSLASYRGARCGVKYAEAFMLLYHLS